MAGGKTQKKVVGRKGALVPKKNQKKKSKSEVDLEQFLFGVDEATVKSTPFGHELDEVVEENSDSG